MDTRKRNILHLSADGASSDVVAYIINELDRRRVNVKRMINARDKYVGGELCMLIRGKDKGRDSWHYVEVSRGLMDVFMKKTRGGTIDVAKYGSLLFSGWGPDPDEDTAQVCFSFYRYHLQQHPYTLVSRMGATFLSNCNNVVPVVKVVL